MSSSIDYELGQCRQSAEEGYKIANAKYSDINNTLADAEKSLSKTDREQSQDSRIKNTELVAKQTEELKRLEDQIKYIGEYLNNLRKNMKDFSIVIYGRTMAGKSTLRETLTHGNGQSIGKGAQGTTPEVHDYTWNGLKITDVPGIEEFSRDKEGREHESKAFEAAKKADLIIFLLSDDAPKPEEAEKLAQLRRLGKPILGVINVKMNFTNLNDDMEIEDLQDRMADTSSINAMINQFKQFAASHNQDWSGIKFVATHLLSAYMSQDKNPTVFRISRFAEVQKFILEKVRNDGRFLRIKTFIDAVSVPMSNIILKIYEYSGNTLRESDVWYDKRKQLIEWRGNFLVRSQEKMDTLYNQLLEQLNSEIDDFVYYYYEDDYAGQRWQQRFKSLKFDEKFQNLLKSLADECDRKRKELSDELATELSHLNLNNNARVGSIQLDSTTAWGKNISTALLFTSWIPVVGWATGAIGLIGQFLFDSKEKKKRQNREKLRDAITPPSYEAFDKMYGKVIDAFNEKILAEGVDEFDNSLCGYQFMLARLGDSQCNMALDLFREFSDLNFQLLVEANNYKGVGSGNIEYIPRIPGEKMLILADPSNLDTRKLSDLLGENVSVMKPKEKLPDTIKEILGSDFDVDFYPLDFDKENENAEEALAIFPKKEVDETKFKLAQQIAGVPIILKFVASRQQTLPNVSAQRTTSSGGGQQNNAFRLDFARIDEMFSGPRRSNEGIKNALQKLETKVRNQRDAAAMNTIAYYYQRISEYQKAFSCRDEFTSTTSNRNSNTNSSGRRTQNNNTFEADFRHIEDMLTGDEDQNNYLIGVELDNLRLRARNQRDADAMRKIAYYYDKIYAYHRASSCRDEANKF